MEIHHISEAGVSFEIQFGLWIKIWAGEHIFLHMAANYRLNQIFHVHMAVKAKQKCGSGISYLWKSWQR